MATLPYTTAPGNIERALLSIKAAATPERVTGDFVKTILKIPGGSGDQITAYLRKIGFVNTDGTPSEIYKRFRNSSTAGAAAAEALKIGYAPLYRRNEFMHALGEQELKGLVLEETGAGSDSGVPDLVVTAIQSLNKFANHDAKNASSGADATKSTAMVPREEPVQRKGTTLSGVGMNLGYTINLNLPATADVAVFNAIFKSLKEHLLHDINEQ